MFPYTNFPLWRHCPYRDIPIEVLFSLERHSPCMVWLRLVASIKWQVSFAKEPYKRDDILPKRPVLLSILRIVATPYNHSPYRQISMQDFSLMKTLPLQRHSHRGLVPCRKTKCLDGNTLQKHSPYRLIARWNALIRETHLRTIRLIQHTAEPFASW